MTLKNAEILTWESIGKTPRIGDKLNEFQKAKAKFEKTKKATFVKEEVYLNRNLVLIVNTEYQTNEILGCLELVNVQNCKIVTLKRPHDVNSAEFHNMVVTTFTYLQRTKRPFILILQSYGIGNLPALRTIYESDNSYGETIFVTLYLDDQYSGYVGVQDPKSMQIISNNAMLLNGSSKFDQFEALKNWDNFIWVNSINILNRTWFETSFSEAGGKRVIDCVNPKDHAFITRDAFDGSKDLKHQGHECNPKLTKILNANVDKSKEVEARKVVKKAIIDALAEKDKSNKNKAVKKNVKIGRVKK